MKLEQAVHIHRLFQREDEELIMASVGDVQFGCVCPKDEVRETAIKVFEQALAWARENLK